MEIHQSMLGVDPRRRKLGIRLHLAEVEVYERKQAKKVAINQLKTARLEDWGDAVSVPEHEYGLARNALIAARIRRNEARSALQTHKGQVLLQSHGRA